MIFCVLSDAYFLVSKFCLVLIEGLEEIYFESKFHKYIDCFKLVFFKFEIFCMIFYYLLFFLVFFLIQVYLVLIMWFVRMENACFKGQKSSFLGLIMAGLLGFLFMDLR